MVYNTNGSIIFIILALMLINIYLEILQRKNIKGLIKLAYSQLHKDIINSKIIIFLPQNQHNTFFGWDELSLTTDSYFMFNFISDKVV